MFISTKLRKESIAEYLLYMWQVEDIIRVYNANLSQIRNEYISQFDYSSDDKEELTDWFGNLILMMNREGKREKGHLQINEIIVDDLNELHSQLSSSSKFPLYNAEYYKVLPFIVELRNKGNSQESEIETCLNALYGTMILKLQNKQISTETQHAIEEISKFIAMLAEYYKKDKTEGLVFED